MDAATKAAEALAELGLPTGQRERMARIVLAAVGYDALRAERDRYKTALERAAVTPRRYGDPRPIARAALDREDT